jgi:hypothetical protein
MSKLVIFPGIREKYLMVWDPGHCNIYPNQQQLFTQTKPYLMQIKLTYLDDELVSTELIAKPEMCLTPEQMATLNSLYSD